uniref:Uncharacterized protein n=1 Tax=Bionectria ochroleuca TaxID=29856 RepID=A0A8H7K3S4_BIOOC
MAPTISGSFSMLLISSRHQSLVYSVLSTAFVVAAGAMLAIYLAKQVKITFRAVGLVLQLLHIPIPGTYAAKKELLNQKPV